jgi:hypothetical protein
VNRGPALVAAVVAAVLALLAATPGGALAQPPAGGVGLTLELDELAPRVVTADGPSVLTVTGTLRNTGGVAVRDLAVRLQRGEPLRGEAAVRDALAGDAATDASAPRFQELPDALAPGDEVPVRLTVPLRGSPETGLALSGAGVHELLVNVNGIPAGGDRARLAAVRMLLPVLGLPAGPDGSEPVPDAGASAVPATLLLPLADLPRRLTTVPVPGAPALLSDDVLAAALAPEGRLGGLVTAVAEAPDGARDAVCVAVDPDLLQTAAAMRAGYEVQRPDGTRVPGAGAEVAGRWLDALADAVAGRCVVALPFADADLVALTRAGLGAVAADAVAAGRAITEDLLGTAPLDATTWPDDGLVDAATLDGLAGAGTAALVLSADGLGTGDAAGGAVPLTGGVRALVADPLLTDAADTGAAAPDGRAGGQAAVAAAPGGSLATQDLLGALAFRTGDPDAGPLLLAPPHRWDVDRAAAAALLEGVARLADAGALSGRPLGAAAAGPAPGAGVDPAYPLGAAEVAPEATASLRDVLADLDDLRSSVVDDERGVDPDELFGILRLGAVRAVSAAWRDRPADAAVAARSVAEQVAGVRASVSVLEPPTPFSLGTSDSPLLLTVANDLPVTVRVRVELASTSGLRVAPIPPVEVPPLGRRQVQANAEVLRSGVFTVDAAVLTEDGGRLGPPSRLQVRSTAYGTITLWLTGTAGVLLVVLAARRILRRIRTEPGRATTTPPPSRGSTEGRTVPVPVPSAAASTAPNPPGQRTGRARPDRSDPASGPAAPPGTPRPAPPRAAVPRPPAPRPAMDRPPVGPIPHRVTPAGPAASPRRPESP